MTTSMLRFHVAQVERAGQTGLETPQAIRSRRLLREAGIFAV